MYILELEKYSPWKCILHLEKYNPCKYILQLEKYSPCKCILHLEKYNPCKYILQFGKIQFAQIYFPIWTWFLLARQQWSVGENSWPQCGEPAGSPGIIRCTNLHPIHINTSRNPLLGDINRCKNVISYLYEIRLGPGLFDQIHSPPLLRIGLIDMYWAMGEVERNIRPLRRGLDRMGHLADKTELRFG